MSTFGPGGRNFAGWKVLLNLHDGIYSNEELHGLVGRIVFDTEMPSTGPGMSGSIDLRAGTSIQWNHGEDELDHYWQMRRMDRLAASWRSLLPSEMDGRGYSDADCWIDIDRHAVTGVVHRGACEEHESTLKIIHSKDADGQWRASLQVSFVWDDSHSEAIVAIGDRMSMRDHVERHGWKLHGHAPLDARMEDGEMVVSLPIACLATIDIDDDEMDEKRTRS